MRKALQALPPACSTAMGLERRAERSYRDGGGSPCLPQPHRSAGCIPAAPQRRCIPPLPPPRPPPSAERFLSQLLPPFHGNPAAPSPLAAMHAVGGLSCRHPLPFCGCWGASPTCSPGPAAPSHNPSPTLHLRIPICKEQSRALGSSQQWGDAVEQAVRGWGWDGGLLALCCRAVRGCKPPQLHGVWGTAQPAGDVCSDPVLNQERNAAHPPMFPFP